MKTKKLVLFGTGDLADIACEYFGRDSDYAVEAFTVDRNYVDSSYHLGLPLVPFENLEECYPPSDYEIHICTVYGDMNRLRAVKCAEAKGRGYRLASYISPHAFISPTAKIGEHAFIFENNVIQSSVAIGNNCILWSGNHIGHHSQIMDNCFLSSHVVVSGHCTIGSNCFIGVNSTLANGTTLGEFSWVSHGSVLQGHILARSMVKPVSSDVCALDEKLLNRALDRLRR